MKHASIFILLTLMIHLVAAGGQERGRVVRLANGVNRITLPDQKTEAMAIIAHRDNFNAHGFDVFTLYLKAAPTGEGQSGWAVVPLFDEQNEKLNLTIGGGADCLLHDFRLLTFRPDKPTTLIHAGRASGQSFADPEVVTFTYFELRKNAEGVVGRPLYYFEKVRSVRSKKKYCDVGQAFQSELGITDYRQ